MKSGTQSPYVTKASATRECAGSSRSPAVLFLVQKAILRVKRLAKKRSEPRRPYDPEEHARNRDRDNTRTKKWADANPTKISSKQRVYKQRLGPVIAERERHKYNTDPHFQLKVRVRARMRHFLKKKKLTKNTDTFSMVGCSPEYLRTHLQHQLPSGASLDTYEVDHIFPLNLYTANEMSKMTNYHNLQPLTKAVNNSKHAKLPSKSDASKVPREFWPSAVDYDTFWAASD